MKYNFKGKEYQVKKVLTKEQQDDRINSLKKGLEKNLFIFDSGMTLYTKNEKNLSLGCKSCKEGKWWCIYVGPDCDHACKFCPQTKKEIADHKKIARLSTKEAVSYLDKYGEKLTGVSYSGGEPFLYLEKVKAMSSYIQENHPHIYQWIYTNGKLITKNNLRDLNSWGIEEIRVNLAATNFNENVVKRLSLCKLFMKRVTVEIPSLRESYDKLIKEGYLKRLEKEGVDQLNLAELALVQDINFETYGKNEEIYIYNQVGDKHVVSPSYSRIITYRIIKWAIKENIKIVINDCSSDTKHLQKTKRDCNLPEQLKPRTILE